MDINALTKITLITSLLEQSQSVFNIKDLDGRYLYANERTRSYFSEPDTDYTGKTDFDFFPLDIAQRFREADLEVIRSGQQTILEEKVNVANGVATHLSVKFPIFTPDRKMIATGMFTIDITQRKNQERQQLSTLEKYQHLITAFGEITYEYDALNSTIHWSGTHKDIFGFDANSVITSQDDWLSRIHPDDLDEVNQEYQRAKSQDCLFDLEYRLRSDNGDYLWFHDRGVISVNAQKQILYVVGVMRHVSDLKRNKLEQEQLQRQLHQIQKMDALGQLTGGIAHDFNNILSSIRGYTELSMSQVALPNSSSTIERYLGEVLVATNRAAQLVQQMLSFSRGKTGTPQLVTPESGIHDAIRLLHSMIPSSVTIEFTLKHHNRYIKIDPINLQQVLINLILNARDAIQEQTGKIQITLGDRAVSRLHCASCHASIREKMISIAVHDTGEGIHSSEVLDRMFDPFFTTKADRKGSGMGLSVVHGIMHSCGGHILVSTTPGQGSCVELLFPESFAPTPKVESDIHEEALKFRNTYRANDNTYIMVLDDEVAITTYLSELLQQNGFQVISFNSPTRALAAFRSSPQSCRLVITDQTMPELTGDKFSRAVLEIRSDIPIIMCSGYSDLINSDTAKDIGIAAYLDKPVEKDKLLRTIYENLRTAASAKS